jgi:hypothetical protein
MIFFGLMGLAALVIDMGFARLAQRQMQTAVDSAALEGLRWRDTIPNSMNSDPEFLALRPSFNPAAPTPDDMDCARRLMASRVVADGPVTSGSPARPSMFANYPDSSGGTVSYGAGPVVNFGTGIPPTDLAAGQTITWPPPPPYQPTRSDGITPGLELNQSSGNLNAREGDMVAGTYSQNTVDPPDGAADEGTTAADGSGNPYHRRDFQNTSNQAFLVRMRRTNNISSNTSNTTSSFDQEGGISSSGPTLPVLFGRGSMMARSGNTGQLSVASGVTVRATAIAATAPARTVGRPYSGTDANNNPVNAPGSLSANLLLPPPNNTTEQLYYVVIKLSQLPSLANSSQPVTIVITGGTVSVQATNGTTTPCGYVADGSGIDSSDVSTTYPNGRPLLGPTAIVGDLANPLVPADAVALTNELVNEAPTGVAYIPIVDDSQSSLLFDRVVGFGYVSGVAAGANGGINFIVGGSSGTIASQNASASLGVLLPVAFATTSSSGSAMATQLFAGYTGINNLLLSPVLVNHYIGPTQ